jgi:recombination protein RecA
MTAKRSEKSETREERLARICAELNQSEYGGEDHNALSWLGSKDALRLERWSSGCAPLDDALGGGWPKGRFIELFGAESSGKSTMALHAIAEFQRKYPEEDIAYIDSEYSFDSEYASAIGVDTTYVLVHQPDNGIQALNIIEKLVKNKVGLIVVDSVAALTTKEDVDGNIGDVTVGSQARMMSPALRRLTNEAGRNGTTIFWTNQVRDKIGISWGDKTTTPAGHALKHYASIRVQFTRIGVVKDGENIVSAKTKADVKKNKCAPPFRKAEFCITFGVGVDSIAALLDAAIASGVIVKRGSWLSMGSEQIGQGRAAVLNRMREDSAFADSVRAAMQAGPVAKSAARTPIRVPMLVDEDGDSEESSVEVEDV